MSRIDYNRAAATYDQGRAYPLVALAEWRQRLAVHLPLDSTEPVLDVGAGTGIWASVLAEWFDVSVVALEPATDMLAAARAKALVRRVVLVAGDAHALPLRDRSCRAAWLSTVIHHLADLGACAAELRRVLRPAALVLIRSSFPGRHDEIPLFRYFPGASRVADTFPTVAQTIAAFVACGFSFVALERIHERADTDLEGWVERVRAMRHADSTLAALDDGEFAYGLASLEAAAAAGEAVASTGLDLLVLQTPHA